ncbi:maleylpyruvate isomerase family mycothiol-dependent enzyme [Streptomyces oceani]|uniref:Mycothiol maleylpyruvate isomerase n=1 Tax=Streptomyces oceani TaxID=1075402 RepID=A0A1E7JZ28_9ACTN|nr:maleylpyruvate isomerase family mycothiol-dependent enzyme [Streptomyces oceani]OEU96912.1 mycothiol maleylpyruvate isomerase [Streptomyces oceani]
MNSPVPDPPAADTVSDVAAVGDATDGLLTALALLDDDALAEPSLLPGWSRGHVLAHLARNADALCNALRGRPMYSSAEARDADIERDAHRGLAAHLDDLSDSADRLEQLFAGLGEEDWRRTVELRNGVTDLAAGLPFRRWIEVELHHADLGIGYTLEDFPTVFLDRETANMAARFDGHPAIPEAIELRAEDGRSWRTGAEGDDPVVVVGRVAALVGWLTGRTSGSGLSASGSLPTLPPL